ncbi:hypothetical protein VCRA2119O147_320049 [Vibrio crassostreae]|nr:hypothetical protein VCRA2116O28_140086 [Vibrio crassostreae]CAK1777398.1 hypothetical protein VCRA2113O222_160106 [Vibrio crassostreae]CAK1779405.1 hypothetical protein VCRA2116O26_150075 [Vibrio crassostreae]CAK1781864.1 hypothetical protein VCRA2119O46_150086 [Vibrio crassostreae]CAK1787014.1 hypothetical protein VCRA2117O40_150076 [Vibrio crassostreae]
MRFFYFSGGGNFDVNDSIHTSIPISQPLYDIYSSHSSALSNPSGVMLIYQSKFTFLRMISPRSSRALQDTRKLFG